MIPVNQPLISEQAKEKVIEALNSGWISSAGPNIAAFEKEFAKYIGTKFALTTTSGTTALQLSLAALGVKDNDEVIIPDQTMIACAFAPLYLGAKPVPVEVRSDNFNLDTEKLEKAITPKTKVIMPVHIYGHPVEMAEVLNIAKKHNLFVLEDCAEAHGAMYKEKRVGSFGDVNAFSFYGNKIITTGEGGMITTDNEEIYNQAKLLKDLYHDPKQRFVHPRVGYNFRMTNLQAGLGLGELQNIEKYLGKKNFIAAFYLNNLSDVSGLQFQKVSLYCQPVWWMFPVVLTQDFPKSREEFMAKLKENGVDTRTFFYPVHKQPALINLGYEFNDADFTNSNYLSARGLYLPSGLAITEEQLHTVVQVIKKVIN